MLKSCKIIATTGEQFRRWLEGYENKGPDKLAAPRMHVRAAPFECAIPTIQLCGFRQGTEHST
jgi:hypothetical protein